MSVFHAAVKLIELFEDPRWIRAALTWPKFSASSFLNVSRLKRLGISPRTVIDIGANVGQFAVAAGKLFPSAIVYSFEPDSLCFEKLRAAVDGMTNVRVYALALGERSGSAQLSLATHRQSNSLLPPSSEHLKLFPGAHVVDRVAVPLQTLDEVAARLSLDPPVLLKIDVQGYEDRVLVGARETLRAIDYALVEVSFAPLYDEGATLPVIIGLMEASGFTSMKGISAIRFATGAEILQMDVLFLRGERDATEQLRWDLSQNLDRRG